MHGEVKTIPLNPEAPHPDLELDDNGLWTFKKKSQSAPPAMEFTAKVVKFHALTRTCPTHGEVVVLTRNFQPDRMHSVEGLSCGCTLLITRQGYCLKTPHADPDNPRNWKHRTWLLSFQDTIKPKEVTNEESLAVR